MSHYTYRAEWSRDYPQYVGRCLEMPWRFELAPTAPEAIAQVEKAVDKEVAEMAEAGEEPPRSFTDHKCSGRLVVRVPLSLHARLTVEAAEQRVPLNQRVVHKLVERPVSGEW